MPRSILACLLACATLLSPAERAVAAVERLSAVVYQGVSAFGPVVLLEDYRGNINQALADGVSAQVQQRLARRYADAGFLPVQIQVHDDGPRGVLLLQVVEPRLAAVRFEGFTSDQRARLETATHQRLGERPLRRADLVALEVALERVAQRPLLIDVLPHPSGVELTVRRYRPFEGALTYSTEGSERLGREMLILDLNYEPRNGPVNYFSLSALSTVEGDGYRRVNLAALTPLADGHDLWLSAGAAVARPQYAGSYSEPEYQRWSAEASWYWAAEPALGFDWDLRSAATLRNYTREEDGFTDVDERLRMLEFTLYGVRDGDRRSWDVFAGIRQGLDALGARRDEYWDSGVEIDFTLLEAGLTVRQALPHAFSVRVDIGAQYSGDTVPFSQRFAFGGEDYVRAFEPAEFSGDRGAAARVELRRGFDLDWLAPARWVPYAWYGVGTVFQTDSWHQSGSGAGAGLRIFNDRISAFLEGSRPVVSWSDYHDDGWRAVGKVSVYF